LLPLRPKHSSQQRVPPVTSKPFHFQTQGREFSENLTLGNVPSCKVFTHKSFVGVIVTSRRYDNYINMLRDMLWQDRTKHM